MRAGRVHWFTLLIVGLAAVFVVGALLLTLFSGGTPTGSGAKFMNALANGDAEQLTELSHIDGRSEDQIRKGWEYAVKVAGPHYRFRWQVVSESKPSDDEAMVLLKVWRNAVRVDSYDERFQLPMLRIDGKWKVDVRGISREMYPGLPR
jgi:hypothetical protein